MYEEYKVIKEKLEKILAITITDEAINNAIEVYNENRATMRLFSDVAAMYPQIIKPSVRHAVISFTHSPITNLVVASLLLLALLR